MNAVMQRETALQRANDIRQNRSALRRELRASKPKSRLRANELLGEVPGWLESCKVDRFLTYFPGIGKVRAGVIIRSLGLRGTERLGKLSPQTRVELAALLGRTGAP
jgi:hypothetical protein